MGLYVGSGGEFKDGHQGERSLLLPEITLDLKWPVSHEMLRVKRTPPCFLQLYIEEILIL